jgi:hypothetical protein
MMALRPEISQYWRQDMSYMEEVEAMEEKILDLIDNQRDYTRSDLQGIVTVLVVHAINFGRNNP